MQNVANGVGSPSSTDAEIFPTVDGLKNLKWLDSLTIDIGLNLQTSDINQANFSASKVIERLRETKQLKNLFSKIMLAHHHANKLFEII